MSKAELDREWQEIHAKVLSLFSLVSDGLAGAVVAFMTGDRAAAARIVERDAVIDALYAEVEDMLQRQLVLRPPMGSDMRYLICMFRIVPELERSGDLVEHFAQRAVRDLGSDLSPRIRGIIERMGTVGVEMWRSTAAEYESPDPDAFRRLRHRDDELDDLHVTLIAEIVDQELPLPVAMELTLVGRFLERLGDHAVNVANRIRFAAGLPTESRH